MDIDAEYEHWLGWAASPKETESAVSGSMRQAYHAGWDRAMEITRVSAAAPRVDQGKVVVTGDAAAGGNGAIMKRALIIFALSWALISQGSAFGQTAAGKKVVGAATERPLRFDTQFWESSGQYWAGVTFDYTTSRGKHELNPAVRNSEGRISGGKFFALNGAVYVATIFLPGKVGHWTRRIIGWTHFTVGGHNLGVR